MLATYSYYYLMYDSPVSEYCTQLQEYYETIVNNKRSSKEAKYLTKCRIHTTYEYEGYTLVLSSYS